MTTRLTDVEIIRWLVTERRFTPKAARRVLKNFWATIQYAGLDKALPPRRRL